MDKYNGLYILLGIVISCVLIGSFVFPMEEIQTNNLVDCFDSEGNKIVGLSCYEMGYTNEDINMILFYIAIISCLVYIIKRMLI